MKTLTVLLALLIKVSLYSQSTFINQRFKNEEYRLFLPGPNTEMTSIGASLSRTDQIYKIDLIEDKDIYIIQNNALKFVCDLNSGVTEVYFNGVLISGVYSGSATVPVWSTIGTLRLGQSWGATGNLVGDINTSIVWNRLMSATEVISRYDSTKYRFGL